MKIKKEISKEVVFGIFVFSFLYRFALIINLLCGRDYYNVISKIDFYYPTINMFFVPYFVFYIHIYIVPYFIGYKKKDLLHKYTTTLVMSSTIAFIIFLFFLTYVDKSIFKNRLFILSFFDRFGNACPSFHVLVTWCIWVHFRQLEISKKIKLSVHILTYLIVFSTVLIRQHGLIDIPAAIVIVEAVNFLTKKYSLDIKLFNFVETKYFKYIKRMFFSILIALSVFLAICFSFVAHYYIKNLTFRENIKEVYVSNPSKQEKSKVSIIIPIYNHEKYLRECLDSVVNQTMNDIEIICINDGSTDGSLDILKEYAAQDDRIKVIDKENTGVGPSRNVGLECVSGEYVMFLDSDDMLRNNACEVAYGKIKESNSDILSFGWNVFTDTNNLVYKKISKDYKLVDKNISFMNNDWENALKTDHPYLWNKIYKTDFIKGYRFLKIKFFAEDVDMIYKLFNRCNKITLIEDVLYKHRISGQNRSLKRDLKTLFIVWKSFAVCIFDLLFNNNYDLYKILRFYRIHLQRYNGEIYH